MKRMKVVRVTKEEFELEDGTVQPMMLDLGYLPTVEEFQQMLDESCKFAGIKVEEEDVGE
jgi:hypothetical protein